MVLQEKIQRSSNGVQPLQVMYNLMPILLKNLHFYVLKAVDRTAKVWYLESSLLKDSNCSTLVSRSDLLVLLAVNKQYFESCPLIAAKKTN